MNTKKHPHPGNHIKTNIIPQALSVTDAADLLGVGRPALSNLLNENAALSPEMAARLEKTFGADKNALLLMQKIFDEQQIASDQLIVKNYIPPFLVIKSRQISEWAKEDIEARTTFAVLIRKLVHSTTPAITRIDFPGYDDAQRKGWDGEIDSDVATAWVPNGKSAWELGCDKEIKPKAEKEYKKRTASTSEEIRLQTTFVFVTPHKWNEKKAWADQKKNLGEWKSVRAYDASDLEQWIEQSIPAQSWLAEKINSIPESGVESIEKRWENWSGVTEIPLNKDIFNSHIEAHKQQFLSWLAGDPVSPLVIKADSIDEGLAFVSCTFDREEFICPGYKDRAIIFRSADAFRKLSAAITNFIPIIFSDNIEKEIGDTFKKKHTILIHPKNLTETVDNPIELRALGYQAFNEILKSLGIPNDEMEKYSRQSGRSITVLRRNLSNIEAVRRPEWTKNENAIKSLLPMVFVGSWANNLQGDIEIMKKLSDVREYKEVERNIATLLQYDDAPVWNIGYMSGVISKIDSLFAIHSYVTKTDLDNFFDVAELVLSEIDPALELPEDQRWAANIYGKTRNHSHAIKNGICETLVILSIHGNALFQKRIGDIEGRVSYLIKKLLTPLDEKKLLSQNNNLTFYAEAAPAEFLKIILQDLRTDEPVISALMKPVRNQLWGGCPRTNLLWALELLAWNTDYLTTVCKILARLTDYKINDNWVNKPYHSLDSIFRSWMPQTSASLEQRKTTLEILIREYPEVGFRICLNQFDMRAGIGEYSYRPMWRIDATGFGQPITYPEAGEFMDHSIELAINWEYHDENSLGELIQRFEFLNEEQQNRVWDIVTEWAKGSDDSKKIVLRETIRQYTFTKRATRRNLDKQTKDRAQSVFELLIPGDSIRQNQWLFEKPWVQLNYDDTKDEVDDYIESQKKVDLARIEALKEIWLEFGLPGIWRLLKACETEVIIGCCMAKDDVLNKESDKYLIEIIRQKNVELNKKAEAFIFGFLQAMDDKDRESFFIKFSKKLTDAEFLQILTLSPVNSITWKEVDKLSQESKTTYWKEIRPHFYARLSNEEINILITNLINVNRPKAAFSSVHLDFETINSKLLFDLLRAIGASKGEELEVYRLDSYQVGEALKILSNRKEISEPEMASLEFMYADFLSYSGYRFSNLQKQLAQSPYLFMEMLAILYKRSDDKEDVKELNFPNRKNMWQSAYSVLHKIKFIPGIDENGKIIEDKMLAWINDLRKLCKEHGRVNVGDSCIGELFATTPKGQDGIWPCEEVRNVLEKIINPKISTGIAVGVYNSRGVVVGADGGESEKLLFKQYMNWSSRLSIEYPLVSDMLREIAVQYKRDAQIQDEEAGIRRRLEI